MYFEHEDKIRAANFLGLSAEDFCERYLEPLDEEWVLNVPSESACPFLLDDACTIHPARPKQCATYPFWKEIVKKPGGWVRERSKCPGIDQGRVYTWAEIEKLLDEN